MKYYSETRLFVRRSLSSVYMEDIESRSPKHEISETVYNVCINEIYVDCKPLKNSDGSFSFSSILNSNEKTETTFWIEE